MDTHRVLDFIWNTKWGFIDCGVFQGPILECPERQRDIVSCFVTTSAGFRPYRTAIKVSTCRARTIRCTVRIRRYSPKPFHRTEWTCPDGPRDRYPDLRLNLRMAESTITTPSPRRPRWMIHSGTQANRAVRGAAGAKEVMVSLTQPEELAWLDVRRSPPTIRRAGRWHSAAIWVGNRI